MKIATHRVARTVTALIALTALVAMPVGNGSASSAWGPDDTFGPNEDGIVTTSISSGMDQANAVDVYPPKSPNQAAGRIVVAGVTPNKTYPDSHDLVLAKYHDDGTPDITFGGAERGGGPGYIRAAAEDNLDVGVNAVAVYPPGTQSAGKIVVVGKYTTTINAATFGLTGFLVYRFDNWGNDDPTVKNTVVLFQNPDPNCSPSVDPNGCFVPAVAGDVAIQPDGRTVVAGWVRYGPDNNPHDEVALVRLNTDFSLDATFGVGGRVVTDYPIGSVEAHSVAIDENGAIVVGGTSVEPGTGDPDGAVFEYNEDGSLDTAWGSGGKLVTGAFGHFNVSDVAVYPKSSPHYGDVLVAGGDGTGLSSRVFRVARFNASGVDQGFGGDSGETYVVFGGYSEARQVLLRGDDRIFLVGPITETSTSKTVFGVMRLTEDGHHDTSFADNGDFKIETPIGSGNSAALGGTMDPSGRVVAAGSTAVGAASDIAVTRYTGPDASGGFHASVADLPVWETQSSYTVKWSANVGGSVTFDVRSREAKWYQSKFGSWDTVKSNTSQKQTSIKADPGYTVCFEARAKGQGVVSSWSDQQCTATPVDNGTLLEKPDSAWKDTNAPSCYRGTYTYSTGGPGPYLLAIAAAVRQLSVVIEKGPGFGEIEVLVDGKVVKTIPESAPALQCGVVVPVKTYPSAGKHNVEIKHVGSKARVAVDGLGVSLV